MEVRASDVFVGRVRELEALGRVLDAMQLGSGATVLIAGEAGIGKTRLVSELAGRARDAGCEILVGRSIDLVGTELPFQPFVEALRPLGPPLRADRSTPGSQLRVFEETLARVTDRAATAPVLLVLEDLHWADTSSLDLLVFLAHNVGEAGSAARDLPRGRASVCRAHPEARGRCPALRLDARARARTART